MRRFFASLALILVACAVHAQQQEDGTVAAERARLAQAREKVEAEFKAQEKVCYRKFAVNDCLATARSKRREAMSVLRRQEIALNDAERKRKAAERQQSIEERSSVPRAAASQPTEAGRQLRADERAAERAKQAASAPARAAAREKQVRERQAEIQAGAQRRREEAAKNVQERERRLAEAKEREERMRKRVAERTKPPASSLPDPR